MAQPKTDTVSPPRTAGRYTELDTLRGTAILLMSTYHLLFDLVAYFGKPLDIYTGPLFWVGRVSALMFMVISGASSTLGKKPFRRGLTVLGAALIVTLVSVPMMGEYYIRFGILHFFAAAMLGKALVDMVIKNRTARLVTAAALVPLSFWLGGVVKNIRVNTPLLLPLGILYPGFGSFDYYPLFPWLGVFCIGVVLGLAVYGGENPLRARLVKSDGASAKPFVLLRPLVWLGKHSLLIYLLHQPLILAVLYALNWLGVL